MGLGKKQPDRLRIIKTQRWRDAETNGKKGGIDEDINRHSSVMSEK